jgi:signal transduction histidine kinase/ligand-binding sensor domain-containing protein
MGEVISRIALAAMLAGLALSATARAERLPIRTYTTEDGLPNDKIWRIRSDSRGLLWFGTSGGLTRYDGSTFVTYGPRDGLTASVIDVIESRDGGYWIATNGQGIVRFQTDRKSSPARFTAYRMGDEPRINYVNTVFEDSRGRIWAGTDSGLAVLDDGASRFHRVALNIRELDDRDVQVWAFFETSDRTLCVATSAGLLRRADNGSMQFQRLAPPGSSPALYALLRDRSGGLWIGGDAGLYRLARESAPIRNARLVAGTIRAVRALVEAPDGAIWAAAGAHLIEVRDHTVRTYQRQQGLSDGDLSTLAYDSASNLWIGTMGQGAMRAAAGGFVSYDEQDGLGSKPAGTILEDSDGRVLVVTANQVINRLEGERFRPIKLRVPHAIHPDRRQMFRDRTGDWWVIGGSGIFRFAAVPRLDELARAAPRAFYDARSGLAKGDVMRAFEDSRGDVWIGYRLPGRQVLTRWERSSNVFHHYSDADNLPAYAPVRMMTEDRAGGVWIAFWEGGLARFNGRFTRLGEPDGVSERALGAVHVDRQGRLWFAATDRIGRIDHPEAPIPHVSYTVGGPFPCGGPQVIAEDNRGNMYFGGVNGIDWLDSAGVLHHESTAAGLASNEVVDVHLARDGRLWITTTAGVSRLNPRAVSDAQPPATLLTVITAGGHAVPLSDLGETEVTGLTLEPRSNQLRVEFAAVDLSTRNPVRFRYQLEGADPAWTGPTLDRTVQYANLAAGKYRFVVETVAMDGRTGPQAHVSFSVLPPFWRSWWFGAGIVLLISAALGAAHRARIARLLAVERVQTRIAMDLHDELGSSLSRIAVLSEVAKGDLGDAPSDVARRMDEVATTARELLASTNDLVWSIQPRPCDVRSLVARIRGFAGELLEGRRVEWSVGTSADLDDLLLSPENRWHLLMIMKEGIHNLVRHADANRAWLTVYRSHGNLVLELRDDGRGFAGDGANSIHAGNGHGLRTMAARAEAVGGHLTVDSAPDRGTCVRVVVPL